MEYEKLLPYDWGNLAVNVVQAFVRLRRLNDIKSDFLGHSCARTVLLSQRYVDIYAFILPFSTTKGWTLSVLVQLG